MKDIVSYLDYFGAVEKAYSCSGICIAEGAYYFSDLTRGQPTGSCFNVIRDDLIVHAIQGAGIAFLVTGIFMWAIWCVQCGLCCRRKIIDGKAHYGVQSETDDENDVNHPETDVNHPETDVEADKLMVDPTINQDRTNFM